MRTVRAHAPHDFVGVAAALLVALALASCAPGVSLDPNDREIRPSDRARLAQHRLEQARAFDAEGRADEAERALREALTAAPDQPVVLRTLARRLEATGRATEAASLRSRADEIDPPPALPAAPVGWPHAGLLVLLLPPVEDGHPRLGASGEWPDRAIPQRVAERLRIRLPEARVTEASAPSIAIARSWLRQQAPRSVLSLTLERASCGRSLKDGPFAMASFRVAVAANDGTVLPPATLREVDDDPATGAHCSERALDRLLERVLDDALAHSVLVGGTAGAAGVWDASAARALFPGLGVRVEQELDRGRAALAAGRTAEADAVFRRALAIDPDDPDAVALRDETRITLALARELGAGPSADEASGAVHEAPLGPAARNALETRIADERVARERWLSSLRATLGSDAGLDSALVASLAKADPPETPSPAQRLARAHAEGDVELRVRREADGTESLRVFVDRATGRGVLREDSRATREHGADTWTIYRDGRRSERFEDRDGDGVPEARLVFEDTGSLARIEQFRTGSESSPLRVLIFEANVPVREECDTNADGRIDRIDHLDAAGGVRLREDDADGDGRVNVRIRLREGRVESREIVGAPRTADRGRP